MHTINLLLRILIANVANSKEVKIYLDVILENS